MVYALGKLVEKVKPENVTEEEFRAIRQSEFNDALALVIMSEIDDDSTLVAHGIRFTSHLCISIRSFSF